MSVAAADTGTKSAAELFQQANELQTKAVAALNEGRMLRSLLQGKTAEQEALNTEVTRLQAEAKAKEAEVQTALNEAGELQKQLAAHPDLLSGSFIPTAPTQNTTKRRGRPKGSKNATAAPATGKRRGRPPGSKNATAAAPATGKRGPGRPKGSKNATAAAPATGKRRGRPPGSKNATAAVPAATSGANSASPTMRSTIWEILGRSNASHRTSLGGTENYPNEARGLKISEIKQIIEQEKLYHGESTNISPMIQNAISTLIRDQKVDRTDDSRNFIIAGAKLD